MNGYGEWHNRKEVQEMCADSLREAGTLVLVFVPIYVLVEQSSGTIHWGVFCIAMAIGITLLLLGIELERRRK
ncbi:MAG TPA: hypothetical protein VE994_16750 [Terriglobales bacterium]|nr:hypothetical protein [Terriglobales bacterium]